MNNNLELMDLSMKEKKFSFSVKNQSTSDSIIELYGFIGQYEDVNYNEMKKKFDAILKTSKKLTILIHSGGGSVYEGLAIYDLIRTSNASVTVVVEGMAASMASVIALAGDKIRMNENAFFMIHAPQGGYYGNREGFKSYLSQLEQCELRLKQIYKERTVAEKDIIENWFKTDTETWLTSEQCKILKICDEIIIPTKKRLFEDNDDTGIQNSALNILKREDWDFDKWQEKDPEGLEKLSIENNAIFLKLFNKRYNLNDYKVEINNDIEKWTLEDWQNNDAEGLRNLYSNNPRKVEQLIQSSINKIK